MKKIILGVFIIFAVALLNAQNIQVTSFLGTPVDTILQRHLQGDGVLISGFGHDVPNSQSSASSAVSNYYTESALSSLASGSINGSASLEFDFIAMADTFAFNYIFASEEYPEFACSSFNDVFAFFLTGIDPVTFINTTKNVAIVPNTITASNPNGIPVAINSINSGPGTSGSSSNCIPPGSSAPYSQYYVNNSSGASGIQYDGRTTALSAQSVIFSCQTYHMKLCLANVGDNAYDSGVFIEEGSFYSPHVRVDEAWETPEGGDTLVQNCRNLDLTFTVDRPALTATTSIVIETSGDAVLGVDYTLIKDNGDTMSLMDNSFFFPAGDTVQLVHVRMLPTAQFADPDQVKEAVLYVLTQGCTGYGTLMDYMVKYDTIVLHLQVRGTEDAIFEWIPATGIDNPNGSASSCNITSNAAYQVIAHDQWNCMADTASVQVTIVPKPEFEITYTPDHGCQPLPVTWQVQYTPNNATLLWNIHNDSTYTYIDSLATLHTSLPDEGYYSVSLTVTSAPGCSDSLTLDNIIHVSGFPHADFTYGPTEPENGQEVFFYNLSTGDNITNYVWNFGDGHSSFVEEPSHTYHLQESDLMTVHLTVTNSDGCSDDTLIVIPVEDNFAFYVPNGFTPNTDGKNEVFLPKVRDVANYEFMIFTRNGEIIFHTTNPDEGWDGSFKGAPVPEGVYLWRIKYARIGTPDEMLSKMGTVTLIR